MRNSNRRDYEIEEFDAVLQSDGSYLNYFDTACWYNKTGATHREDGPAIIYSDGRIFWRLNGFNYTFNDWCIELNKSDEEKMLLRLRYA
jgi:hypothetical protein